MRSTSNRQRSNLPCRSFDPEGHSGGPGTVARTRTESARTRTNPIRVRTTAMRARNDVRSSVGGPPRGSERPLGGLPDPARTRTIIVRCRTGILRMGMPPVRRRVLAACWTALPTCSRSPNCEPFVVVRTEGRGRLAGRPRGRASSHEVLGPPQLFGATFIPPRFRPRETPPPYAKEEIGRS